jgi:hypothetical protein
LFIAKYFINDRLIIDKIEVNGKVFKIENSSLEINLDS